VDGESSEPAIGLATLRLPRKSARKRLRVRVHDKNRLDGKRDANGVVDRFLLSSSPRETISKNKVCVLVSRRKSG